MQTWSSSERHNAHKLRLHGLEHHDRLDLCKINLFTVVNVLIQMVRFMMIISHLFSVTFILPWTTLWIILPVEPAEVCNKWRPQKVCRNGGFGQHAAITDFLVLRPLNLWVCTFSKVPTFGCRLRVYLPLGRSYYCHSPLLSSWGVTRSVRLFLTCQMRPFIFLWLHYINASVYNDILDSGALPTPRQQFVGGPFLF